MRYSRVRQKEEGKNKNNDRKESREKGTGEEKKASQLSWLELWKMDNKEYSLLKCST